MSRKRLVSTIAMIVMMIVVGATLLILPLNTDRTPLVLAENEPPSGLAQQGEVIQQGGNFTANTKGQELSGRSDVIQLAKPLRPAATADSPEDAELKKQAGRPRPDTIAPPTPAELADRCDQNPKCRAKLDQGRKGQKPSKSLPAAAGDSPEDAELKKHPAPSQSMPPHAGPRSELTAPAAPSLLTWLNPFGVAVAQAQTPWTVTLTPTNNQASSPSYAFFTIYGGLHQGGGSHSLPPSWSVAQFTNTENKPYLYLYASIPVTGWYLISVRTERGVAKLRHLYNGPIIETWDFMATSTCQPCDYVTTEYLAAGSQYFYFWMTSASYSNPYIFSVTLKTAP